MPVVAAPAQAWHAATEGITLNPYAWLFYLWMTFHAPHYPPGYIPPPPVYWQATMPVAPAQQVIMPPCRVVQPRLSVCS